MTREIHSYAMRVDSANMPSLTTHLQPDPVVQWTQLRMKKIGRRYIFKFVIYIHRCRGYYVAARGYNFLSSSGEILAILASRNIPHRF